ncbi:MAG: carboxypeptidase regulatory-like domain-containing protein [Chitinispirillaceae bacterium]
MTKTQKLEFLPLLLVMFSYQFGMAAVSYVTDTAGYGIAGQRIEFYWADSDTDSLVATFISDSNGTYSITTLGYGYYNIHFPAGTFPSQWQGIDGTTTDPQFRTWVDPAYTEISSTLRDKPTHNPPISELRIKVVDSTLNTIRNGGISLIRKTDSSEIFYHDLTYSDSILISSLQPGTYAIGFHEATPYPKQFYSPDKNTSYEVYPVTVGIADTQQITITAELLPEGDGVLTGTISDSLGPVSAATVELYPAMSPLFRAYSTVTGTDGTFQFSALAQQDYHIKITTSDGSYPEQWYSEEMLTTTVHPEYPVHVYYDSLFFDIQISKNPYDNTPKGCIKLQLFDKNNDTIKQSAEVWASDHNGSYKADFKPDLNEYWIDTLQEGSYSVRVIIPGHPTYYYGPDSAVAEPYHYIVLMKDEVVSHQLTLKSVTRITNPGYVKGSLRDYYSVLPQVHVKILDTSMNVINECYTDDNGDFGPIAVEASVPHLVSFASSFYPLQYWSAQKNTSTTGNINHFQTSLDMDVDLSSRLISDPPTAEELVNMKIIDGYVVDASTQTPLYGVEILPLPEHIRDTLEYNPWYQYDSYSVITDSTGYYSIEDLPYDRYVLLARKTASSYIPQFHSYSDMPQEAAVIDLSLDPKATAQFELRSGGTITGTVKTSTGFPVEGARVELEEKNGGLWHETWSDNLGRYKFEGLQAKQFTLKAYHYKYAFYFDNTQECTVTENTTIQANDIILNAGSVISGNLTSSDQTVQSVLQNETPIGSLRLLNDSATTDTLFIHPEMYLGINHHYQTSSSSVIFSTARAPEGSYKLLFTPHPQDSFSTDAPFSSSLGWSFAETTDYTKTPTYTVTPPDSVKGVTLNIRKGYEVYGTVSMSDPAAFQEYEITAYIKSGSKFIAVSRSNLRNSEQFGLPGLIDGEDYYIRISMAGMVDQYWNGSGSSVFPDVPYHFSTTDFVPLDIVVNSSFTEDSPEPSLIKPVSVRQTGFARIELSWMPPPEASPSKYNVYRFPGNPDLYRVTNGSEWEPRISTDSLMKISQVMKSTSPKYVDTNVTPGKPYIYCATWKDHLGRESRIVFPYPPELDQYVVNNFPAQFVAKANEWYMMGLWGGAPQQIAGNPNSHLFKWDDKRIPDRLMSSYIQPTSMKPTDGYWFKSTVDTLMKVPSTALKELVTRQDSIKKILNKGTTGWNQISSPYPFSICPAWMSSRTVWEWLPDSGGYRQASELRPWKAYWVHTEEDTTLSYFPLLKDSLVLSKKSNNTEWEMRLALRGEGGYDPDNFLGISSELGKKTALREPEPPLGFDSPQLYFLNEINGDKLSRFYKGSSSATHEWRVAISPSTKNLTLSFEEMDGVSEDVNLYWIDQRGTVDIRSTSKVDIPAHSKEIQGYVVATTEALKADLFGGEIKLQRTGPNPFRKITALELVLPYSWENSVEMNSVSINIYDLKGRIIRRLLHKPMLPGRYRIVWNGKDQNNRTVPKGIYLMRMQYGKVRKSLKLIKAN